jgi:hypothetical protein
VFICWVTGLKDSIVHHLADYLSQMIPLFEGRLSLQYSLLGNKPLIAQSEGGYCLMGYKIFENVWLLLKIDSIILEEQAPVLGSTPTPTPNKKPIARPHSIFCNMQL